MPKFKLLFIFIISTLIVSAQESIKPKTNFKHILGLDVGYGSYGSFESTYKTETYGYQGEVNLNYIFNYRKCFFAKLQAGIAPTINFGIITKCFMGAGFTTNMNKPVSWHISSGLSSGESSKKYVLSDGKYYYEEFSLRITLFLFMETGFYIKPMKLKNHYIGVNFSTSPFNLVTNSYHRPETRSLAGYINVSYNIQLNKPRNTQ
jgi:hypothetical protein